MAKKLTSGILWRGFDYKWDKYPHRISVLGSRFNNVVCQGENCSGYHEQSLKMGNTKLPAETAHYGIHYSVFNKMPSKISYGRTSSIEISSIIEEGNKGKLLVEADFGSNLFSKGTTFKPTDIDLSNHLLLLNGFVLKPLNNDSGWHFGGFGLSVQGLKWKEDAKGLSFVLEYFLRPAHSPELFPHGRKKVAEDEKWDVKKPCKYQLEIDFCVISSPKTNSSLFAKTAKIETKSSFVFDEKVIVKKRLGKEVKSVISGINAFKFLLDAPRKKAKRTGRYLRSFGLYLSKETTCINGNFETGLHFNLSNTILKDRDLTAVKWNLNAKASVVGMSFNKNVTIDNFEKRRTTPLPPGTKVKSELDWYKFPHRIEHQLNSKKEKSNPKAIVV